MKRLGLGVSEVEWTTTFDCVVKRNWTMAGNVAVLAAHYRNLIDMGFANHAYEIQCQGFAPHPEPDRGSPPNPEL